MKCLLYSSRSKKTEPNRHLDDCKACNSVKLHVITSKNTMTSAMALTTFDSDIAGPFKIEGLKNVRYFITIFNQPVEMYIYIYTYAD